MFSSISLPLYQILIWLNSSYPLLIWNHQISARYQYLIDAFWEKVTNQLKWVILWASIRVYIIFVVWIKIQTFTSNNCIFNCCRKLCLWNQQIIKMAKSTCSALPMVCIHHAWTLSLWTMPIALNFDDFSCRPAAGWVPAISWGFPSRVP